MPFGSLWLPVVLSAIAVFMVSAIAHMVLKHHTADHRRLPNEEVVRGAVRSGDPAPALYFLPHCAGPAAMKDPAVIKKFEDGPVAILTVLRSGPPAMGKHLAQWAAFCFVVSFVSAYVARITLHPGSDGMLVLRVTGTVAFAGYALGYLQDSIWKGIPWANSLRGIADAVAYSLVTGFLFRLLWPAA